MIFTATVYLLVIFGLSLVGSGTALASDNPTQTPGVAVTNIILTVIAIGAVLYLAGN
jgi:hypothetical protein